MKRHHAPVTEMSIMGRICERVAKHPVQDNGPVVRWRGGETLNVEEAILENNRRIRHDPSHQSS